MQFKLLSKILLLASLVLFSSYSFAGFWQTWNGQIAPRTAIDFNSDPNIVEVVIVAHKKRQRFLDGSTTEVYAYNGTTPGPTIEGKVGDTLIVHFINLLPEETTIHWHGLKLPASMDGSHIAQTPVKPGGYFRYEFPLLDAATFWYHPHVRSYEQVEKSLYGALVVHDPSEKELLNVEREHVLVLDDILLDDDNNIVEHETSDPLLNAYRQVNGREGNHLLVNGKINPTGKIQRGVPHRLRLVNTSNSRFMRVSIPNHTLWRVGGDQGLLEHPIEVPPIDMVAAMDHEEMDMDMSMERGMLMSNPDLSKGILLTPGERADVVFVPKGDKDLTLQWHDVPRGLHNPYYKEDGTIDFAHDHMDGMRPPQTLMTFKLFGNDPEISYQPPDYLRTIEPIDTSGAVHLPIMMGHSLPNANGDITFFMQMMMQNGTMTPLPFSKVTPETAPTVTIGEKGVWEVANMTGGMHNFHTHGFSFQLLETEYVDMDNPENNYVVPAAYLENKDTIMIPARPGAKGRSRTISRLAVSFDDEGLEGQMEAYGKDPTAYRSGGWMVHCHILEHIKQGMGTFLQTVY